VTHGHSPPDTLKQAILSALTDTDMVRILDCAMFKDKSVNDIEYRPKLQDALKYSY